MGRGECPEAPPARSYALWSRGQKGSCQAPNPYPNMSYGTLVRRASQLTARGSEAHKQKTERLDWFMHTCLAYQRAVELETVELARTTACMGFGVIRSCSELFGVIRSCSELFGLRQFLVIGNYSAPNLRESLEIATFVEDGPWARDG